MFVIHSSGGSPYEDGDFYPRKFYNAVQIASDGWGEYESPATIRTLMAQKSSLETYRTYERYDDRKQNEKVEDKKARTLIEAHFGDVEKYTEAWVDKCLEFEKDYNRRSLLWEFRYTMFKVVPSDGGKNKILVRLGPRDFVTLKEFAAAKAEGSYVWKEYKQ